jgi:hypothetical protein
LFHLLLNLPRLIVGFQNKLFLRCGVVSSTLNPQPGEPGYPFSTGVSPLTCLAWEALPVAYAIASIALGFDGHYMYILRRLKCAKYMTRERSVRRMQRGCLVYS